MNRYLIVINDFETILKNGVLFVLAWAAWVVCLLGWNASMGGMGGMLGWIAWVVCLGEWRASMLTWLAC